MRKNFSVFKKLKNFGKASMLFVLGLGLACECQATQLSDEEEIVRMTIDEEFVLTEKECITLPKSDLQAMIGVFIGGRNPNESDCIFPFEMDLPEGGTVVEVKFKDKSRLEGNDIGPFAVSLVHYNERSNAVDYDSTAYNAIRLEGGTKEVRDAVVALKPEVVFTYVGPRWD